jgi:hypothetical protein
MTVTVILIEIFHLFLIKQPSTYFLVRGDPRLPYILFLPVSPNLVHVLQPIYYHTEYVLLFDVLHQKRILDVRITANFFFKRYIGIKLNYLELLIP